MIADEPGAAALIRPFIKGRDVRRWVPELWLDADDARSLGLALGRIGPRDRQVLAYRYFAGLSEAETARAAGVAVGTVKSRTARALAHLRTEMEQQ